LVEVSFSSWIGFCAVLGAVVGSFLNVVIHRLPRGESIIRPRSRCPSCGWSIPAWANIPLLSYAALRGRCHGCGQAISLRYPLVELLGALLFAALAWGEAPGLRLLASWLLGSALLATSAIDLEHHIIPNEITFPGMILGIVFALLAPPPIWPDAAAGLLIGGGLMWAISAGYERLRGQIGLGMGDVKLVAMLGAFLGLEAALGVMVLGSLLGLLHGALLIAWRGGGRQARIPFGPALAVAGVAHLFVPGLLPRLLGAG
jgi:leader peptidase (prepilin peptidase)/N-methyltransferase